MTGPAHLPELQRRTLNFLSHLWAMQSKALIHFGEFLSTLLLDYELHVPHMDHGAKSLADSLASTWNSLYFDSGSAVRRALV